MAPTGFTSRLQKRYSSAAPSTQQQHGRVSGGFQRGSLTRLSGVVTGSKGGSVASSVVAKNVPRPVQTSSLKKENGGQDITAVLVNRQGGKKLGWGSALPATSPAPAATASLGPTPADSVSAAAGGTSGISPTVDKSQEPPTEQPLPLPPPPTESNRNIPWALHPPSQSSTTLAAPPTTGPTRGYRDRSPPGKSQQEKGEESLEQQGVNQRDFRELRGGTPPSYPSRFDQHRSEPPARNYGRDRYSERDYSPRGRFPSYENRPYSRGYDREGSDYRDRGDSRYDRDYRDRGYDEPARNDYYNRDYGYGRGPYQRGGFYREREGSFTRSYSDYRGGGGNGPYQSRNRYLGAEDRRWGDDYRGTERKWGDAPDNRWNTPNDIRNRNDESFSGADLKSSSKPSSEASNEQPDGVHAGAEKEIEDDAGLQNMQESEPQKIPPEAEEGTIVPHVVPRHETLSQPPTTSEEDIILEAIRDREAAEARARLKEERKKWQELHPEVLQKEQDTCEESRADNATKNEGNEKGIVILRDIETANEDKQASGEASGVSEVVANDSRQLHFDSSSREAANDSISTGIEEGNRGEGVGDNMNAGSEDEEESYLPEHVDGTKGDYPLNGSEQPWFAEKDSCKDDEEPYTDSEKLPGPSVGYLGNQQQEDFQEVDAEERRIEQQQKVLRQVAASRKSSARSQVSCSGEEREEHSKQPVEAPRSTDHGTRMTREEFLEARAAAKAARIEYTKHRAPRTRGVLFRRMPDGSLINADFSEDEIARRKEKSRKEKQQEQTKTELKNTESEADTRDGNLASVDPCPPTKPKQFVPAPPPAVSAWTLGPPPGIINQMDMSHKLPGRPLGSSDVQTAAFSQSSNSSSEKQRVISNINSQHSGWAIPASENGLYQPKRDTNATKHASKYAAVGPIMGSWDSFTGRAPISNGALGLQYPPFSSTQNERITNGDWGVAQPAVLPTQAGEHEDDDVAALTDASAAVPRDLLSSAPGSEEDQNSSNDSSSSATEKRQIPDKMKSKGERRPFDRNRPTYRGPPRRPGAPPFNRKKFPNRSARKEYLSANKSSDERTSRKGDRDASEANASVRGRKQPPGKSRGSSDERPSHSGGHDASEADSAHRGRKHLSRRYRGSSDERTSHSGGHDASQTVSEDRGRPSIPQKYREGYRNRKEYGSNGQTKPMGGNAKYDKGKKKKPRKQQVAATS